MKLGACGNAIKMMVARLVVAVFITLPASTSGRARLNNATLLAVKRDTATQSSGVLQIVRDLSGLVASVDAEHKECKRIAKQRSEQCAASKASLKNSVAQLTRDKIGAETDLATLEAEETGLKADIKTTRDKMKTLGEDIDSLVAQFAVLRNKSKSQRLDDVTELRQDHALGFLQIISSQRVKKNIDEEESAWLAGLRLKRSELQKQEDTLRPLLSALADKLQRKAETDRILSSATRGLARDKSVIEVLEKKCSTLDDIFTAENKARFELQGILRMSKAAVETIDTETFLLEDMDSMPVASKAPAEDPEAPAFVQVGVVTQQSRYPRTMLLQAGMDSNLSSARPFDEETDIIEALIASLANQRNADMDNHQFCINHIAKNKRSRTEKIAEIDMKMSEIRWAEDAVAGLDKTIEFLGKEQSQLEAAAAAATQELKEETQRREKEATNLTTAKEVIEGFQATLQDVCNLEDPPTETGNKAPAWFPTTKDKCWLAYCNAYAVLRATFCQGKTCAEKSMKRCKSHFYKHGIKEGRLSADKRHLFPLGCGGVPTEDAPTETGKKGKWTLLLSTGSFGHNKIKATEVNRRFQTEMRPIVRRRCADCANTHREMYFVRKTNPSTWDAYEGLFVTWRGDQGFHDDFDIYSTIEDVCNDRNPFQFCNGNDPGVGFPRDCGPKKHTSLQWTSFAKKFARPSRKNVEFTVSSWGEACQDAPIHTGNTEHVFICEWHLAPKGANECDYGSVASEDKCEIIGHEMAGAATADEVPGRQLVSGSWSHVPSGCSVQFGGDWAPHFNKKARQKQDGRYSLVCSGAKRKASSFTQKSRREIAWSSSDAATPCKKAYNLLQQAATQLDSMDSTMADNLVKIKALFEEESTEANNAKVGNDQVRSQVASDHRERAKDVVTGNSELDTLRNAFAELETEQRDLETTCGPKARQQRMTDEIDASKNALDVLNGESVSV